MSRVVLLVATKKGAFFLRGTRGRDDWKLEGPHQLGHVVHHVVLDPRDGQTLLMAAKTGHLGPTVFRSRDWGQTWTEAKQPPAFAKTEGGKAVDATCWLTPGLASEPEVWWAGTTPHGLFRSEDGGASWTEVATFTAYLDGLIKATPERINPTPDGAITHSISVDPRDARHLYVGLSVGGVFESLDAGATWRPLNRGVAAFDFMPVKDAEYGHDPHCVVVHPAQPDRLYMQNHCGIYRLDRPGDTWVRIGDNMPKEIGDIGFGVVTHPRDPETAWVFPMDGTTVWPRTSPDGKPAVYRTRDGGATWKRQDRGFPKRQAWLTVKRQAFANDARKPVGLYLGTTSGEIWASASAGKRWKQIAQHLPSIQAVVAVERDA